ncbi:hypothetical protein [Deinococcus sp. YIM 77859]|uniref:hypothetical protein n=1 Tax=Deinococcus sp. YIM 77859 TaxID=1540221 RepID=UPI00054D659F|nr:hypothetical protein [Deinococcus sp. YIM 77859]
MRPRMLGFDPGQSGGLALGEMVGQRPEEAVDQGLLRYAVQREVTTQHLALPLQLLRERRDVLWSGQEANQDDRPE